MGVRPIRIESRKFLLWFKTISSKNCSSLGKECTSVQSRVRSATAASSSTSVHPQSLLLRSVQLNTSMRPPPGFIVSASRFRINLSPLHAIRSITVSDNKERRRKYEINHCLLTGYTPVVLLWRHNQTENQRSSDSSKVFEVEAFLDAMICVQIVVALEKIEAEVQIYSCKSLLQVQKNFGDDPILNYFGYFEA
ncbi:unnamed protein product [Vicia faba]|uniref:Uncharacterized protein n=1 Tax=Vicia faba TaxID=3906 RepID=A0AAV0ZKE9_VICFA|nr:unnamed protein product [Vicia faba]